MRSKSLVLGGLSVLAICLSVGAWAGVAPHYGIQNREGAKAVSCGADTPIATVLAPGFSCTLGDKTFSNFSITDAPSTALVEFKIDGPIFAVSLSRDGGAFSPGTVDFDYTVAAAAPEKIVQGTIGLDVATTSPAVLTTSTMNGQTVIPPQLMNSQTASITFNPGVSSVNVADTSVISPGDFLTTITNDFTQAPVPTVGGVPEPATISLFGFGLAALGFAARRDRRS